VAFAATSRLASLAALASPHEERGKNVLSRSRWLRRQIPGEGGGKLPVKEGERTHRPVCCYSPPYSRRRPRRKRQEKKNIYSIEESGAAHLRPQERQQEEGKGRSR